MASATEAAVEDSGSGSDKLWGLGFRVLLSPKPIGVILGLYKGK